jgi:hypothetical protein
MAKEIIIVEKVDGDELLTNTQAFEDVKKAEEAFVKIIKDEFSEGQDFTDEDYEEFLEDGFFTDLTHFSVILKHVMIQ